jgi:hypothetical protein
VASGCIDMRQGLFLIVTLAGLLIAGPALAQAAEP